MENAAVITRLLEKRAAIEQAIADLERKSCGWTSSSAFRGHWAALRTRGDYETGVGNKGAFGVTNFHYGLRNFIDL